MSQFRHLHAFVLLFFLAPASSFGATKVSGYIASLGAGRLGRTAQLRFWLRGCSGNQPRIPGGAVIAPSQGGKFYFDIVANRKGRVSGTLYSNRDNSGTGGGEIECGGSYTSTWYGMQVFIDGQAGPEIPVYARQGAILDPSNVTPIATLPLVAPAPPDSTDTRLEGSSKRFTGPVEMMAGARSISPGSYDNDATRSNFASQLGAIADDEFHNTQAGFAANSIYAGAAVPSGAMVQNVNAVYGAVTSAADSGGRLHANAVGGYFTGRALGSNAAVWGINPLVNDVAHLRGANLTAIEADVNVFGAPSFVRGIATIIGGSGTVPRDSIGVEVFSNNLGGAKFTTAYLSGRAAANTGLVLGGISAAAGTNSQEIAFQAFDSGNKLQQSSIQGTLDGSLSLGASSGAATYIRSYGVNPPAVKSQTLAAAASGFLQLASVDSIAWRDNANTRDIALAKDAADRLTFAGNTVQSPLYDAAGTLRNGAHQVIGTCTLDGSCTVTLIGPAAFTGATSYVCHAQDQTGAFATRVTQLSGSSFRIEGTGTDVIGYSCAGN